MSGWRDRARRGDYSHLPEMRTGRRTPPDQPRSWLIPGAWPWGTIPALGGNYKAGKSTIVTDLTRALLLPGYRFLDHFDPVPEDIPGDWGVYPGVVVINAETPPEDFEAAIDRAGMDDEGWSSLTVEHLEELGGAHSMDITDPDIYDLWAYRLARCDDCDESDDWPPVVVIVDGVTAILQAAGKGPEDFGLWYAAFRRLLHEVDVSNGLATGHNTMGGAHLMGGTGASAGPDALWTLASDNPDKPNSPRRFSVTPRMGGVAVPSVRVVLNEDRRPVVSKAKTPEPTSKEAAGDPEDFVTVVAHRTAAYVREHPGADGQQLTDNVDAGGWKQRSLEGRAKALELGLMREERCRPGCSFCTKPHPRRTHYWPV